MKIRRIADEVRPAKITDACKKRRKRFAFLINGTARK